MKRINANLAVPEQEERETEWKILQGILKETAEESLGKKNLERNEEDCESEMKKSKK